MGCASSKEEDLPAVALCRDRLAFLDEASRHRYDLADAHRAYLHSLRVVGSSFHRFFDHDPSAAAVVSSPSPVLNLPPAKKKSATATDLGPFDTDSAAAAAARHSGSNSGSHLQFHSDSDDSSFGSLHHSGHASPLHFPHGHIDYASSDDGSLNSFPHGGGGGGGGAFMHMNFMKSRAMPSVSYEQRPMSPEIGRIEESSYFYNPPIYPNSTNPSSSSSVPFYGYSNYGGGGGGGMGGYYGTPPPPYRGSTAPPMMAASSSSSKQPPPPPSPPRSTTWDFLNLFDTSQNVDSFQSSYPPPYTPSRDSKELREEEGIPDLEDVGYQQEVVKEVHGTQKFVDGGAVGGGNYSKAKAAAAEPGPSQNADGRAIDGEALYQARPSASVEEEGLEYDVHMVDKKVVDGEKAEEQGNVGAFKGHGGPRGVSEVVKEIQVQFERASASGDELAKLLEVGKLPYRKNASTHVSSTMRNVISPSLLVVSSQPSSALAGQGLEIDEDLGTRSKNLSSTLQKCYLWEKKLFEEVKAEEKLRIDHEKKCRKLRRLDERGAEASKLDATRTLIRSLSTKIRIAIQMVDKISIKINKLRDEELWPQIYDLIQGLTRMWKSMLECHHSQCQAIKDGKSLDAIAFQKKFSDNHLRATMELEQELINWTIRFSSWIHAQKGYVRALNKWLMKCLLYVPEETADGIVPFSPGRMGAPPLFVICNQWSQAMERISEKEVVESIRVLAMSVLQLWERDKLEMRQRLMTNKDLERKVKNLEREDQKIQKGIQALDKMALVSGDGSGLSATEQAVYQGDASKSSLQACLQHMFEAMERLAAKFTKAYEELLQRSEEERLAQERGENS